MIRLALLPLLLLSSCAWFYAPPATQQTVERSIVDPPAGAILARVAAYADLDTTEDPRIVPVTRGVQEALTVEGSVLVLNLSPLATGGLLNIYYMTQTRADSTLLPETIEGRVLAAELLGTALERVLSP